MSDLGDDFRAMREESRERRSRHRTNAPQILFDEGISFTSKNNGAHLLIREGVKVIADFWPGTGLWRMRDGRGKGRDVYNLIRTLTNTEPEKPSEEV